MKVLHCVGTMRMAGIETFIMNVYRNINRDNVQFAFLCENKDKGDYDEEILQLGGEIYYLDSEKFCFPGPLKYLGVILRNYSFFLKHRQFQYVHIHNHHAFDTLLKVIGCKLGAVKNIYAHSHNTFAAHPKLNHLASTILVHTKVERLACGVEAGKWLYGKESDFTVINNGISVLDFQYSNEFRKEVRKELEISDNDKVLIHVGRFEAQKNHSFLIDIFDHYNQLHPNAKLLLIGEGDLMPEIKEKISNLKCKDNIQFLGKRSDVCRILSASDVFLMPSLFEGLPVVGIEAQSSGIDCVFSDEITREIDINPNVEFLSLNESTDAWREKIDQISKTRFNRNQGSVNIENKGYSIAQVAKQLEKIYLSKEGKYCD